MSVFCIANQKGGTGKTTLAVNLSVGLAEFFNKRVLLIDMDPQANATLHLDFKPFDLKASIVQVLLENDTANKIIQKTKFENLSLLPSAISLAGAEVKLVNAIARECLLKEAIKELRYDFIFIDCPPSLGLLTVNSLVAAEWILIPLQAEFFALEGLSKLLETVEVVKTRLNSELKLFGIALTIFNTRRRISYDVVGAIQEKFKSKVFETKIRNTVKICEAPSYGTSIFQHPPKSKGAEDFYQLTKEFLRRWSKYQKEG
jgi:chromosome partitioning protein